MSPSQAAASSTTKVQPRAALPSPEDCPPRSGRSAPTSAAASVRTRRTAVADGMEARLSERPLEAEAAPAVGSNRRPPNARPWSSPGTAALAATRASESAGAATLRPPWPPRPRRRPTGGRGSGPGCWRREARARARLRAERVQSAQEDPCPRAQASASAGSIDPTPCNSTRSRVARRGKHEEAATTASRSRAPARPGLDSRAQGRAGEVGGAPDEHRRPAGDHGRDERGLHADAAGEHRDHQDTAGRRSSGPPANQGDSRPRPASRRPRPWPRSRPRRLRVAPPNPRPPIRRGPTRAPQRARAGPPPTPAGPAPTSARASAAQQRERAAAREGAGERGPRSQPRADVERREERGDHDRREEAARRARA